jgi:hypothetical protein
MWVTRLENKVRPIPTYFEVHRTNIDGKYIRIETLLESMKTHVK